MGLRPGTKLRGKTKKHPGRIVIIGSSGQKYRIRFDGGQHNGKAEQFLPKFVVEGFYEIVKQPGR